MRNLTNTEATDLTGLHVQLVDPLTGEQHKTTPADSLGDKLWTNASGVLTNTTPEESVLVQTYDTAVGTYASLSLDKDTGVTSLAASDKVVLNSGGEYEFVNVPEDVDFSSTAALVYNQSTYKVEWLNLQSITGDQYKTTSTTCQNIVPTGNITLMVEPGLAYTPLQDIIVYADASNYMHGEVVTYNTATGELVMSVKQKDGSGNFCSWTVNLDAIKLAEVSVYYGTTDPTTAGQAGIEGDLWYITATGTGNISASNPVLATYVYDSIYGWQKVDSPLNVLTTTKPTPTTTGNTTNLNSVFKDAAGDTWIVDSNGDAIKAGSTVIPVTTSLTPVVWNGSAYVNAQASAEGTLADLITLSDGTRIHDGEVTWTGHGLTVGRWYYLSTTTAGAYVTPQPTSGWVQQLFFVEDANTIHVDIEEGWGYTSVATTRHGVEAFFQQNATIRNGVVTDLTNQTTVFNTAGSAWNPTTGVFTAARAGWYDVSASMFYNAGNWNAGGQEQLLINVNGSYRVSNYIMVETAMTNFYPDSIQTHHKVYLNVGDQLKIQAYQGSGSDKTIGSAIYNRFSIVEIG